MNFCPVSSGEESDHYLSGRPRTQYTDRAPFLRTSSPRSEAQPIGGCPVVVQVHLRPHSYGVTSVGLPKAAFRHTVGETVGSSTCSLGNTGAVDSRDGWWFDSILPQDLRENSSVGRATAEGASPKQEVGGSNPSSLTSQTVRTGPEEALPWIQGRSGFANTERTCVVPATRDNFYGGVAQ